MSQIVALSAKHVVTSGRAGVEPRLLVIKFTARLRQKTVNVDITAGRICWLTLVPGVALLNGDSGSGVVWCRGL